MNIAQRTIQKILEIFDSTYPVKYHGNGNDNHSYSFQTDKGNFYDVNIEHIKNTNAGIHGAYVNFTDEDENAGLNHNEKNTAHKILGTVAKIMKDHAQKHPDMPPFKFSGDKYHAPVYQKLSRKIANNHTEIRKPLGSIDFTIHPKDLK